MTDPQECPSRVEHHLIPPGAWCGCCEYQRPANPPVAAAPSWLTPKLPASMQRLAMNQTQHSEEDR